MRGPRRRAARTWRGHDSQLLTLGRSHGSPSAPLASLTPDKRAAVELVLRRGLSYGELADLLSLSEDTVRERARPAWKRSRRTSRRRRGPARSPTGCSASRPRPTPPAPARSWPATPRCATGPRRSPRRCASSRPTSLAGRRPPGAAGRRAEPARGRCASPRPLLRPRPSAAAVPDPARRAPAVVPPGRRHPHRLAVVIVGAVIAFVLTRGGKDDELAAGDHRVHATATPTATATLGPGDVVLRGPAGSKALGVMQLFRADDDTVRFLLVASGIAPNKPGERYSLWMRKKNGQAQLLGDASEGRGQVRRQAHRRRAGRARRELVPHLVHDLRHPGGDARPKGLQAARQGESSAANPPRSAGLATSPG